MINFTDIKNPEEGKKAFIEMLQKHGINPAAWKDDWNSKPENLSMSFRFDTEKKTPGIAIKLMYKILSVEIDVLDPVLKEAIEKGEID